LGENHHPDYVVGKPNASGVNIIKLIYELKRDSKDGSKIRWAGILEQLWNQCDANNNISGNGRMWAVGQRGLFICIFK
jgi:hypothetical protein